MYTTLCKEEANSERGAQKWLIAHFLQNQPPLRGRSQTTFTRGGG